MPKKSKELTDLWITVSIMISLSAYHLMVNFSEALQEFFKPIGHFPQMNTLAHCLYVWMLGLLYIAYQRWRKVVENENELTSIMSSTGPAVVLVIEPERGIKSCNDSVEHVFGFKPAEVIGKRTDFLYGDRRQNPNVPREIYGALEKVGFHIGEALGRHKDGSEINLEIITAEKKGEAGAVLLIKDITARKKAEQAVVEAKEAAEKAYREKEQLIEELELNYQRLKELESTRDTLTHMIVHDMKTPLQVLALNAELLQEMAGSKLEGPEVKSLSDMRSYCTHLDVMMKSMLDVSRMEEEKLPLNRKKREPKETMDEAVRLLGTIKDNHEIQISAPAGLPDIEYDEELVQRVLLNLLINAIKYSPADSAIKAELSASSSGVTFTITDQGIGIPAKQLRNVFKKFGQVNDDGNRLSGSTGLGLTFCRLAVEAHGGEIGVRSAEGAGSTFWFNLPSMAESAAVSKTAA